MDLQVGSTVGDYQIVGVLGAGGMGSVYQVRSLISDRMEALKVLLPDLTSNAELSERFLREIKVLGSLEHPNIAQLRTAFRSGNQLLMVMEFVDGDTLEKTLRSGPLPVLKAVDAISQVLSALEFAHAHGVIHRDIKPANIMMTKAGVVKLMDFGIAKPVEDHHLTSTGTTMGSLYYMSPEQIQGAASLDGRADLYSLGVTLYQLVTGKRPFDGDSQYAIMAAHLQTAPVPPVQIDPALPQALNDVILMSVAKNAADRFQTAAAFRNALAGVASTLKGPTEAMAAPPTYSQPPQSAPPGMFAQTPPRPMPTQLPGPVSPAFAPPPQQQYQQPQMQPQNQPQNQPQMQAMPPRPMGVPAGGSTGKSKRGLWMALGGVAVAAAVIGVIEFGPFKHAKADSTQQQQLAQQQQPQGQQQASGQPGGTGTGATGSTQPGSEATVTASDPKTSTGGSGTTQQPQSSLLHGIPTGGNTATSQPGRGSMPKQQEMPTQMPVNQGQGQSQGQKPQQYATNDHPTQPQPGYQPPQENPQRPINDRPPQQQQANPNRQEILQAREHVAKLHVRADSIRESLGSLRRSMQAQGHSLSSKFTQPEGMMNTFLRGATDALAANDLIAAKDYAEKAESQIEVLEKLLNM